MSDLRSILGYSKGSPWEFASENLIHSPEGKISMANTKQRLKAYDAKTGKFLSFLEPGEEYQFPTDKILEMKTLKKGGSYYKRYQTGGTPVDSSLQGEQNSGNCPEGFVFSSYSGKCEPIQNGVATPQQTPIQKIPSQNPALAWMNPSGDKNVIPGYNEFVNQQQTGLSTNNIKSTGNEGTISNPMGITQDVGVNTDNSSQGNAPGEPPEKKKKRIKFGVSNTLPEALAVASFGLSAFANKVEQGRQKAWNKSQFASNFNQTFSNAQNDYGVNPYEQTGQLRNQFAVGGNFSTPLPIKNIKPYKSNNYYNQPIRSEKDLINMKILGYPNNQSINTNYNTPQTPSTILQNLGLSASIDEGIPSLYFNKDIRNGLGVSASYSNSFSQGDPGQFNFGLTKSFSQGGIHINPANKGKFTALKERTGKSTEELTHSSNPLTRKRAIFAQNAAKWHHQNGGRFDPYHFLGMDEVDEDAKPTVVEKKKSTPRITEDEIDELTALGLSPEDILKSTGEGRRNPYRQSGQGMSGFQSFDTAEEGAQALENQIDLHKSGKSKSGIIGNETMGEYFKKYAPSSDNNDPVNYAQNVSKWTGYNVNTPIKNIPTKVLAKAITRMEGNKVGNNPGNLRKFQKGGTYTVDFGTMMDLQKRGIKFKLL